jgi:glycosyltransferase involved in cell wall biosynthesis
MMPLSVVIITFNEEKNIGRCLDSVKEVADEIVVVDSLSTDNTLAIAREKGAIVHLQPFLGYIEQKNKALSYATYDFVLCLDADEALDKTLENSINEVKDNCKAAGYTINRCTNYCGKFIRHGSWYPDKKLRLFNRAMGQWGGINPHDKVLLSPAVPTQHIKGDILHYSYNSLDEHISQNNRFSNISAETYFKKGKRSGWFKIIVNPVWAFVKCYFVRLGFLDGFLGFVIARNIAHLTFMKYYKLYALAKGIPVQSKR